MILTSGYIYSSCCPCIWVGNYCTSTLYNWLYNLLWLLNE
jgi:hypothetical protein